jgi:hypothetical protein
MPPLANRVSHLNISWRETQTGTADEMGRWCSGDTLNVRSWGGRLWFDDGSILMTMSYDIFSSLLFFDHMLMCRRLEEPRPELDIDLNPGESESRGGVPGLGSRTQVQAVDGSGPTKKCH